MEGGRGWVTEEGCLQGLPPTTRWQHTHGSVHRGDGPFPSSQDSRLRTRRTPGLNALSQAHTSEFRKGKESKTKHHRKVQSLVFMEFES